MTASNQTVYRYKDTDVTFTVTSDPSLPVAEVTGNLQFGNITSLFAMIMTTEEFGSKIGNNSAWELVDPAVQPGHPVEPLP